MEEGAGLDVDGRSDDSEEEEEESVIQLTQEEESDMPSFPKINMSDESAVYKEIRQGKSKAGMEIS